MQAKLAAQLQEKLQEGLTKLALTLRATAKSSYPTVVTIAALERLEKDPEVPDFMRSSIRALAFTLQHLQDEQAQTLV